jgi:dTDP-4-dehydrorhamnose 3,5-epimerase
MIDGVVVERLKIMKDDRGAVMRMIRKDSPVFNGFGELYFSTVNTGTVKAWKKHARMTQLFAVPVGSIRLVIFDDRAPSATNGQLWDIECGEDNYCLIKIPPLLWYGFKGLSASPSLIANCADIVHDPDEITRCPVDDPAIPYKWK